MITLESIINYLASASITVIGIVVGNYAYRYMWPVLSIIEVQPLLFENKKYWRVIIKNTGRTGAEECTGFIHLKGNELDVLGGVCWSKIGNPDKINLNVDEEQALDIFLETQDKKLIIPTEKGWRFLRPPSPIDLTQFNELDLEVRTTSMNAKPCSKKYKVIIKGGSIDKLEEIAEG